MARVIPQIGMEVTVEGFAGRDAGVVAGVEDGARRVIVDCGGERLAFTLRRLTGRYVQEREPYYGVRLRLVPVVADEVAVEPPAGADPVVALGDPAVPLGGVVEPEPLDGVTDTGADPKPAPDVEPDVEPGGGAPGGG
jgi:hypothetical protein